MSKALLKHKWLESCKQEQKQAAAPATAEDLPAKPAPFSAPAADAAPPAKTTAEAEAPGPGPAAVVEPPVARSAGKPTASAPEADPPQVKATVIAEQPASATVATAQQSSSPPPPQQVPHHQQLAAPPQLAQQQPERQTQEQPPGPPQGQQQPTQQSPQQLQIQQSLDSQQDLQQQQQQQQHSPPQALAVSHQQQPVSQSPPRLPVQQPDTKLAKAGASAAGGPIAAHQGSAPSPGLPHPPTAAHRAPGHHHTPHGALNRTKSGQPAGMLGLCLDNAITLSARPVSRPTATTPNIPKGRAKQEQRKQQQPKQEQLEQATDKAADKPVAATKVSQPGDKKGAALAIAAPSGSGNQSHTSHDATGPHGTRDDAGSRPQSKVEAGKESSAPGTATPKAATDKKATQAADKKANAAAVAAGKKQQQSPQQKGVAAAPGKAAVAGSAAAGVKRKAADASAKGGDEQQQPAKKKTPGVPAVLAAGTGTGTDESHEGVKRSKAAVNKQPAAVAAVAKESSRASGSDQQGQSRGVKRQEVGGSGGSPAHKPPANGKASRAAGEQPPHKQSRLAKQSSTNAVSAAKALAAAAADLSDEDDDDHDGDDHQQVVAAEIPEKQSASVKKEKPEHSNHDHEANKPSAPATAAAARKPKIQGRIMLAARFIGAKQQTTATAVGSGHVKQEEQQQQLQQHQTEVFIEPPEGGQWQPVEIEISKIRGWSELWRQVSGRYAQLLPRTEMPRWKVVYLDSDGDWVVANNLRWQAFCEAATKVLVTSG